MAYIVDSDAQVSDAASTTFDIPIPAGHQANDILLAIVSQDGGGTTIAATGWTEIGTQAANQAQRTAAFWKLASSSSEADLSLTGANDDWAVTVMVIRGANTTTPVHQNNRTDSADSAQNYLDSGTVTTTENNCLILYAWGFDQVHKLIPADPNELVFVSKQVSLGNSQIVGYRNLPTAGATTVVKAHSEVQSEGGTALVIAISDATPSTPQLGPDCREAYRSLKRYGGVTSAGTTTAALIRHDGVTWDGATSLAAATIDGTTVINIATFAETSASFSESPWGGATGLSCTGSAVDAAGRWVGNSHAISSTDMSGSIFSLQFQLNSVSPSRFGSKGVIVVFQDGSGNWVAHTLSVKAGMLAAQTYVAFVDLEGTTPLDSSGTMDWTDVTRVGYLLHKVTSATAVMILYIRCAVLLARTSLVDGCAAKPCSPAFADKIMNGWGTHLLTNVQGVGQALWKSRMRYGDGTRKTYADASATSFEFPQLADSTIRRRFWRVPAESAAVGMTILASANDTIKLTNCLNVTDTKQALRINPASSGSATYDFTGSVNIGWEVTNDVAGVVFNNATFRACHGISLLGGGLDGCVIKDSITSPAVTTSNPGNITNCEFISAGSGHAIEITTPGTYDFDGNTFSGYGADASTDAAIYNNSGGAVTLNLGSGDATPTVRNGAGASTTVVAGQVDVLVTVIDEALAPIENIRVYVVAADGTGPLPFEDSVAITRSGSTATVSHTAHGLFTGDKIRISGAAEPEYNGVFTVTVTTADAYEYTVSGTPATPATGTILATGVLIYGLTDANGEITVSRSFSSAQPVTCRARSISGVTTYVPAIFVGTVSATTGFSPVVTLISDA